MAIEFRNATLAPLRDLSIAAPDGAIIGIAGERGSGEAAVMRLAGVLEPPATGEVISSESRRYLGVTDALNLTPADLLVIDHTMAASDALARAQAGVALERLRSAGSTVLLASHEPSLLRNLCDEVWWFDQGRLAARGDPREILQKYSAHISRKFRAWGETLTAPLTPAMRRGDGRAEIVSLKLLDGAGKLLTVVQSGEPVTVRVSVRFIAAVADPVIGIMIRTRIGLEVYGTNTELEKVPAGPAQAGETVHIDFRFRCDLCPKEYTLTAASHDPDGTAHDWMDDAISFVVTDSRFTAGVANLRAEASCESSLAAPGNRE